MSRILIRLPNWLGDAVMASGALARFAENHPNDEITLLGGPASLPVFQHTPFSWSLTPLDQNWYKGIGRLRDSSRSLHSRHFDISYLLTNSFSSALLFRLASVPKRIGYSAHSRSFLLTQAMKKPHRDIHHSAVYNQLLNGPLENIDPVIHHQQEERESVNEMMHRSGVEPGRIIGIAAGAAYGPAKCWPGEYYTELAKRCVSELDASVVLLGSKAEAAVAETIVNQVGHRVISLAGKTTLRQLFGVIDACSAVVCNDSGVMHVASAIKRPLLVFFGPTNAIATGPLGTTSIQLNNHLDCAPCMKRVCPLKHHNCMREITVDEALASIKKLLTE